MTVLERISGLLLFLAVLAPRIHCKARGTSSFIRASARTGLDKGVAPAGKHVPLRSNGSGGIFPGKPMGDHKTPAGPDILRGTLDLLILQALSWGPAHGYAVARWIQQATGDALAVGEGTLYPALHRLEERKWISASWGTSANNRQAKFYALTKRGRGQLVIEAENWRRYAAAVFAALEAPASDQ
jgi:transcriptional regulator